MEKKNKKLLVTINDYVMRGKRDEMLHVLLEENIKGRRSVGQNQNVGIKDVRKRLEYS